MPQNFKDLQIWKLSFDFASQVYKVTFKFPKDEMYGMTSQLRRAALSISNNIAEGCGRRTNADFCQFLYNSMGSVKECENLLLFAKEQNYLTAEEFANLMNKTDEIGKKLTNFIKAVQNGE
ncbi:four helix bundle protein [Candidatus Woesearchaeota archaeon]|nr:four helix bundle protein [Candidatus Woesearchaeota archaeon]